MRIFEPESHHVVPAISLAPDDGAIDTVSRETELGEQSVGNQIQAVAIVPVSLQQFLEGRPVILAGVSIVLDAIVTAGFPLCPAVDFFREVALLVSRKAPHLQSEQSRVLDLLRGQFRAFGIGSKSRLPPLRPLPVGPLLPFGDLEKPGVRFGLRFCEEVEPRGGWRSRRLGTTEAQGGDADKSSADESHAA